MPASSLRKVAIVGGARIPFCRSNGRYAEQSNQDLLTGALTAVVNKYGLAGEQLGEVAAGAVLKHSRDFNLTRESVLSSGLAPTTPAYDVQQACGTSLETAILVGNKIATGQIECGIAAGTDTTSDAPIALNNRLRKILLEANRARSAGDRFKALARIRPGHLVPDFPAVAEPRTGLSMGQHCELMAKHWQISREAQDELAVASHHKAAEAYTNGFFDDLVIEHAGVKRDDNLRADTSVEAMAKLKPAFDKQGGTLTAANSTPLTDGASAVFLASEEYVQANGLPVLAYLTEFSTTAAVDFVNGDEGLLMAPAYAVPRMLERAGLTLQDFDFYEIHEAFAAQVLCTLKAWESKQYCVDRLGLSDALGEIDRSKLNVKGSSLAVGHPFAATGTRILGTLAKIIDDNGGGRGLISICAAGGMGVTAIVERAD
jgi:acetyl-CoA C-acetyltransferase